MRNAYQLTRVKPECYWTTGSIWRTLPRGTAARRLREFRQWAKLTTSAAERLHVTRHEDGSKTYEYAGYQIGVDAAF